VEATGQIPDLLPSNSVLTDRSSTNLVQQAEAAGAKTLMTTADPDRIIDIDAAGQQYFSKPFCPTCF
jgi:hypothetical protein